MTARTLVAGIGNVLLGDDGFGVEVARRLRLHPLPEGVRVEDFGVRALHLAYELLEPYEAVVLVDAMARGDGPGHGAACSSRTWRSSATRTCPTRTACTLPRS